MQSSAEVYKGSMRVREGSEPQEVAIKRMSPQALQGLQNFQREARALNTKREKRERERLEFDMKLEMIVFFSVGVKESHKSEIVSYYRIIVWVCYTEYIFIFMLTFFMGCSFSWSLLPVPPQP